MVTFANNPFARWQPAGSIPCAQPTASHIVTDARNTPFAQWQPAGAPIPAAAKNSSLLFSSLSFPSVEASTQQLHQFQRLLKTAKEINEAHMAAAHQVCPHGSGTPGAVVLHYYHHGSGNRLKNRQNQHGSGAPGAVMLHHYHHRSRIRLGNRRNQHGSGTPGAVMLRQQRRPKEQLVRPTRPTWGLHSRYGSVPSAALVRKQLRKSTRPSWLLCNRCGSFASAALVEKTAKETKEADLAAVHQPVLINRPCCILWHCIVWH
eukprot:1159151-Pelagomonas_calceolata.AAC.1